MVRYSLNEVAPMLDAVVVGDGNTVFEGVQIDSRNTTGRELFVPIIGERVNGHSFVSGLLADGRISASLWQKDQNKVPDGFTGLIVDNTVTALQKLAALYRSQFHNTTVIGVTGSSGKTSTKDIICSVLSRKYHVHKTLGNHNNEIGVPLTILSVDKETDEIAVIEMGISDFGEMQLLTDIVRPDYTVITSIFPAHIMNFHTLDNIVHEKCSINRLLPETGKCFYSYEAYGVKRELDSIIPGRSVSYGFEDECDICISDYHLTEDGTAFRTSITEEELYIPLFGKHLVLNACSAIGLAKLLGLTDRQISEGLAQIEITPHRMQLNKIGNTIIIDDAYNSNPGSLVASLKLLGSYNERYHRIAVLGDMLELGENSDQLHAGIADQFDFNTIDEILLYGDEMKNLQYALGRKAIDSIHFKNKEDLVEAVRNRMKDNSVILFKASNGMGFIPLIEELED